MQSMAVLNEWGPLYDRVSGLERSPNPANIYDYRGGGVQRAERSFERVSSAKRVKHLAASKSPPLGIHLRYPNTKSCDRTTNMGS